MPAIPFLDSLHLEWCAQAIRTDKRSRKYESRGSSDKQSRGNLLSVEINCNSNEGRPKTSHRRSLNSLSMTPRLPECSSQPWPTQNNLRLLCNGPMKQGGEGAHCFANSTSLRNLPMESQTVCHHEWTCESLVPLFIETRLGYR